METWREEIQQLKNALAEKEEQLCRAVKRRRMRTVAHVEILRQLNTSEVALKESNLKCASLQSQLQEIKGTQGKELMEQEEGWKHKLLVIEEEFEKKLEEQNQKSNEENEALREQLIQQQEKFEKLLEEEENKYHERIREKEQSWKQELFNMEQTLADVTQRWEQADQKWVQMREELEDKLKESNRFRQEEAEETAELQRLTEAVLHLEVRCSSLCSSSRSFQMMSSEI